MKRYLAFFLVHVLALLISACDDHEVRLSGGFIFLSEGPDTQEIWPGKSLGPNERYIPCNVVGYDYNSDFIVAKQVAREACYHIGLEGNRKNMFNQHDGQTYFWIIDAQKRVIHGPYSEPQFAAQRKQLGVSEELKVDKRS
jgi:hypothetical protein